SRNRERENKERLRATTASDPYLSSCSAARSSALQKGVQRVEAFEAAPQNFFVRQSFPSPAFENAIDANAFVPLKLIVIQISIVDHLANLRDDFVRDRKTPD